MPERESDPDDALAYAVSRGDEQAAAALYARYARRVHRIVYRVLLDERLARDTAQEAWCKIFRGISRYRPGSSLHAWISTIAARCAIDIARKRERHREVDLDEDTMRCIPSKDPPPRQEAEEREIEAEIQRVLRRLPAAQRAAFVLRHYEGESLKEVAGALGCSPGTAKTHVYRAACALRRGLAKFAGTLEGTP